MNEPIRPIGPAPEPAPPTAARPASAESPEFRRILERLEKLAKEPVATAPQDADQLQDAMRSADARFTDAMDLRRKLEEAFRARSV